MAEIRKRQLKVPPMLKQMDSKFVKVWEVIVDGVEYHAITSLDAIAPGDERWHISVSGKADVPPWNVMAAVAHELRPGVVFCIGCPPRSQWINVAEHCLHFWELRDDNLTTLWRAEGRGHTPS